MWLQMIISFFLLLSAFGIVLCKRPLYSALFFLATLLELGVLYLTLSAEFIAVMQILVYAGAILVIFVFVIVLFQDAHAQIEKFSPRVSRSLCLIAFSCFAISLVYLISHLHGTVHTQELFQGFGQVSSIGESLYTMFFFPFEATLVLFLVAIIGAIYLAKKES